LRGNTSTEATKEVSARCTWRGMKLLLYLRLSRQVKRRGSLTCPEQSKREVRCRVMKRGGLRSARLLRERFSLPSKLFKPGFRLINSTRSRLPRSGVAPHRDFPTSIIKHARNYTHANSFTEQSPMRGNKSASFSRACNANPS